MINEILQIGGAITNAGGSAAFMGLLVVLAFPKLKRRVFGNGNNDIKKEIDNLKENHLHDVDNKLDKLIDRTDRNCDFIKLNNELLRELLFILKNKK